MPGTPKRSAQPQDVYLLRTVSDPQISPDGRHVAYTVAWNDQESNEARMSVYLAPVDGRRPARRFTQGKHDHSPRWSADGRHLAFVSNRGEKNQLFVAPLDGGEPRQVTRAKFGVGQPAWSPDGRRIAYAARVGDYKESKDRNAVEKAAPRVIRDLRYKLDGIGYFDSRRLHIFTVDIESGRETQVTDGDWHDDQPSWSPDGRSIAFVSDREAERFQRQWRSDIWVTPSTGGRARRLTRARGGASYPAYSPDGRHIAFVGHEHGEGGSARNSHLMIVAAAGGRAPRSLSAPIDRSVVGHPMAMGRTFAWLPDGAGLLFLAGDRGTVALYRTGLADGGVSKVLDGERQVQCFALAPDGRHVAFAGVWPSEPSEVYATVLNGRSRERNVSNANEAFRDSVDLGRIGRITYAAPDGLEIEAFVLYPPDYRPGRRYPLVLEIHGGPHGVHPPVMPSALHHQTLAAAGYVVLMPNPRGSTGYGEAFSLACVRDWGGKDFEDLMAGVDELVRRGVADPERLYVGGYSYGGFMTTWTVGHSDRFRAAVIGAPVADQMSMFGTSDIPRFDVFEIGGTPWDNPDEYRHRSPTTYLPNVKSPVLLIHFEGDLRCPMGQSEEIFQGLRMLGKEVEFVRYPGGSHGVHAPSQQVDHMRRIIEWYEGHAPPGKAASTPTRRRRRPVAAALRR